MWFQVARGGSLASAAAVLGAQSASAGLSRTHKENVRKLPIWLSATAVAWKREENGYRQAAGCIGPNMPVRNPAWGSACPTLSVIAFGPAAAVVFPFVNGSAVGQMADAVFVAVFVLPDFGLPALLGTMGAGGIDGFQRQSRLLAAQAAKAKAANAAYSLFMADSRRKKVFQVA